MAKRIRRKPTLGNRVPIVIMGHWPMIVHVFDSSRLACPKGAKGLQRVLTTGRSEFGDLGRLVAADLLDHAEPATPSLGSFPRRTSVVAIGGVSAGHCRSGHEGSSASTHRRFAWRPVSPRSELPSPARPAMLYVSLGAGPMLTTDPRERARGPRGVDLACPAGATQKHG